MNITSRNNKYPGLFLATEGIDGAGKTEATRLIAEAIRKQFPDHELVTFRAPGGTPVGEKIRSILLGNCMQPTSELLMFIASHNETIHQVIIPALKRGAIVLTDRFIDSTYAYQGYGRGLLDEVEMLHRVVLDSIEPDHVIYVTADQNVANSRIQNRGEANHFDELENKLKNTIREGMQQRQFNRMREDFTRMTVIENNGTMEDFQVSCKEFVSNMVLQETYFSAKNRHERIIKEFAEKLKEVRLSCERLNNRLIQPDDIVLDKANEELSLTYNKWFEADRKYDEFLKNNSPETFNKKQEVITLSSACEGSLPVTYDDTTCTSGMISGGTEDIRTTVDYYPLGDAIFFENGKPLRTNFKDHEIAKIVSEVTNLAIIYAGTQQLRQNISAYLVPIFKTSKEII